MEFEKQLELAVETYDCLVNGTQEEFTMGREHIKDFIQSQISQAIEEEREKMIKIIESMPDIARGEFDPEALSKSDLLAELERK